MTALWNNRFRDLQGCDVLPVPQAMMSLPRSAFLRPAWTLAIASFWCWRSFFLGLSFKSWGRLILKSDQSIGLSSKS